MAKRSTRAKSTKSFADLSVRARIEAVRRIRARVGYAGFQVVSGTDQNLRARGVPEKGGEDAALSFYNRTKLLNLVRNGVRNSPSLNAVLKQFEVNVVGTVGGKASFVFQDERFASNFRDSFGKWCRSIEYFDGMAFGEVLKKTLITYLIGGDIVLMFDKFTGKIVAFEPDCINDLDEGEFARMFPAGWTQRQGRVFNESAQFCGVIVSHSQRGSGPFHFRDQTGRQIAFVLLKNDPNGDPIDEDWIMVRNAYRFNQGRGTPPFGASLGSVIDLEDVTKFEVQAAKANAQTIAQIYQTSVGSDSAGATLSDGTNPNEAVTNWSEADDKAVQEALEAAREEGEDFTFDEIRGAGVIFNKMPAGAKMELMDTKHPNANMPQFIRWLEGRTAASLGLGALYATMHPEASYTQFRGEQVLSWPTFEELQKFLEQNVCDWVLGHFARRYELMNGVRMPDGWLSGVSWQWPRMREVDAVDEQNALQLKIKNFTGSFREVYGPNWRERVSEIAEEVEFFKSLGIPHPGLITVAGAVVDPGANN